MIDIAADEPKIKMPDIVVIHLILYQLSDIDPICKASEDKWFLYILST